MPYGDSPSGDPVGGGRRARKSSGGKRACKYGRGSDGYCNKKPKSKRAKRPCKYGRGSDGYCKKKPREYDDGYERSTTIDRQTTQRESASKSGRSIGERAGDFATGAVTGRGGRGRLARLKTFGGQSVRTAAGTAAGVAALGGIALAGIAAYSITTYLITRKAKSKAEKDQQKYELAVAYREARKEAARQQGFPLNAEQLATLASTFKRQLQQITG